MKKSSLVFVLTASLLVVFGQGNPGTTNPERRLSPMVQLVVDALNGRTDKIPHLPNGLLIPMPSGGFAQAVAEGLANQTGSAPKVASAAAAVPSFDPSVGTYGCPKTYTPASGFPVNVRANQDCGFRFQSEEWVSINPTDPTNILVSQNDSKLNGNRTGVNFSLDGGAHFGDSVLPTGRTTIPEAPGGVWSFDALSDPASAFDSQGNFYYTAIAFDFAQDGFDAIPVWKSNSCVLGTVLHTPGSGSCDPFTPPLNATGIPIRSNFDNPLLGDDKQLMAADASPTSPYRDNVYMTWTIFDATCGAGYCQSPIFFSKSTDGGVSWSDALEISGNNPDVCRYADFFGSSVDPHDCNFDQGSYPVVGPDGTIYVVFNNSNTTRQTAIADGVAQQLFVKSTDGGDSWSQPVKIASDFSEEPFSLPGDKSGHGCPLFRQCLSPNGYRMNNFPSLGIDDATGKLAAYWSDFRHGGPCAVNTKLGIPIPVEPCDNHNEDVFVSVSSDGGATWSRARLVSSLPDTNVSDPAAQWQQWGDVGENGKLYVAYYDRQYGDCETTGCNDITLAVSSDDGHTWTHRRISSGSMPNLECDDNVFECTFLGDYMSTIYAAGNVYMVWGDTRGRDLGFPEEDIFFAKVQG
jgi:hypothetical protein